MHDSKNWLRKTWAAHKSHLHMKVMKSILRITICCLLICKLPPQLFKSDLGNNVHTGLIHECLDPLPSVFEAVWSANRSNHVFEAESRAKFATTWSKLLTDVMFKWHTERDVCVNHGLLNCLCVNQTVTYHTVRT